MLFMNAMLKGNLKPQMHVLEQKKGRKNWSTSKSQINLRKRKKAKKEERTE